MMKSMRVFCLTVCMMLMGIPSIAGQMGNPAELVAKGNFEIGIEATRVFKQPLEDFSVDRVFSDGTVSIDTQKDTAYEDDTVGMSVFVYGYADRLNLFAKLGKVGGGEWVYPDWEADLSSCFVWALGAEGIIFEPAEDWKLGFGLQYLRYDNRDVDNWRQKSTGASARMLGWNNQDELDYWQVDAVASLSRKFGSFTPWAGVGVTYGRTHVTGNWSEISGDMSYHDDGTFSNEKWFTGLAGVDIDLGRNFTAGIQGTIISRTTVTLGITYHF